MITVPLETLLRFLLLLVRLGAIFFTLPFFGARTVPAQLKLVFLVALSFGLFPTIQNQPFALPHGVGHFALLVIGEMLIGMSIGFATHLLFAGIQLGGELLSQQMGLSLANIFDPQNAQPSSLITNFQYLVAALLFFSMRAHHWFLYAMAESLHRIPLLGGFASAPLLMTILSLGGNVFTTALSLAAPVSIVLLLATVAMGIMARLVPQMNIFILSFPINLGLGLLGLGLALPFLLSEFQRLFTQLGQTLVLIMRALGTG